MTRTYIINMAIGLSVCGLMIGIASIASAHEGHDHDDFLAQVSSATEVEKNATLSEDTHNRIVALADNMTRKMTAAQERFYNIADRLEARKNIIEQTGINTDDVANLLTVARTDLDTISNSIITLDQSIDDIFTDTNPIAAWENTRKEFETIKAALKEVHGTLSVAIETARVAMAGPEKIETTRSEPIEPLGTIPKEVITE